MQYPTQGSTEIFTTFSHLVFYTHDKKCTIVYMSIVTELLLLCIQINIKGLYIYI